MSSAQQTKLKILLVGDSCTDTYVYGDVKRFSPESPIPILNGNIEKNHKQGMAGNVRQNLEAFGCDVNFLSNDPTLISKTRFVDRRSGYQLLRLDEEETIVPWEGTGSTDIEQYDGIVISDYGKGFLTYENIQSIIENYTGPIFIDTKKQDLEKFNGCFVKINELEDSLKKTTCDHLIVTKGSLGAFYQGIRFWAPTVDVHDVCGAGDTFLAALAYKHLSTGNLHNAIAFANRAASIAVQHTGVYVLTKEDIASL